MSSLCPRWELRIEACVRACVCEEEEASQLLQKRGKDRFEASKLHNSKIDVSDYQKINVSVVSSLLHI